MTSNKYNFYITLWNKYLSVIRILLKKSASEEQTLMFNRIDFERIAGIRKSGYKFTVNFIDGRPDALFSGNDLVQTFITVLQTDEFIGKCLSQNNYTFVFTTKYQLSIKKNGATKQAESALLSEEILTAEPAIEQTADMQ
jgi:hypothetical protein